MLKQFNDEITRSHKDILDDVNTLNFTCCEIVLLVILNVVFGILIIPLLFTFYQVKPNEYVILEAFGKPIKVIQKPGLHWTFLGISKRKVTRTL